jgi:hypothetical protein
VSLGPFYGYFIVYSFLGSFRFIFGACPKVFGVDFLSAFAVSVICCDCISPSFVAFESDYDRGVFPALVS